MFKLKIKFFFWRNKVLHMKIAVLCKKSQNYLLSEHEVLVRDTHKARNLEAHNHIFN